ncbi:MAG: T9SS type A sorting domain-containing protein [Cyclobacteriaceae bacterium]
MINSTVGRKSGELFKRNYPSQFLKTKVAMPLIFLLISASAWSQAPTVSAPTVSAVTTTDATLGGTVTGTLTHRGTRWHTSSPVGANNQLEEASATAGAFTQARTGLPSGTKIFFLAYARNGVPEGISTEASFFTEPTQLTGGQLTATATSSTAINLNFPTADSWEGSGSTGGYVIFRKAGSAPSLGALADGAAPPADGVGDKIATITDGTFNSFNNNTGLSAATDYYYTIIPFVWDGATATTYNYNTSTPQTANDFTFATEPGSHATGSITATPVSSTQINLSFNSVTTSAIANAAGYIVLVKSSAIVVGDLATLNDGTVPNGFGLFEAIINSTGTSTYSDVTGLSANTTYHYAIIPYNRVGNDQTYNYLTTTGFATGSATTLAISATFTPIAGGTAPVPTSTVLSAGVNLQVLTGFSVTSEGTQVINSMGFNYTGLTTQITNEYLYRSTTAGSIGSQLISDNSPDGNFDLTGLGAGDKTINSTPVYYYLVVDVLNSVNQITPGVTVAPTQANIAVATGIVNAFSINRALTFNSSQLSDITFANSGTTALINYRFYQGTSIGPGQPSPPDAAANQSLGDFIIRDGGGSADPDNRGTTVTSITIQLTNFANVRQIALFDDNADTEIAGTEQTVTGNTVTFTPTTPIVVPDDGTFQINVRASFQSLVTDNQQVHVTITGVTSTLVGSGFAAPNAGGATTSSSTTNVINVVATKLIFTANPPATAINQPFALTVRAVDSNPFNTIDLDYTGRVGLTKSPASGTLTAGAQSLSPNLIAGQFAWTDLRITAANSYTLDASDDGFADAIGDASGSVTITSSASTITQPAILNLCFGGLSQTLGNIVITETDPSGFSSGGSFALTLPNGFIFDQSVTTAPSVGGGSDISAPSTLSYPASNTVQFSYTISGTANTNTITITGLKIMHPHPGGDAPGTNSGSITRSGGTASIAGVSPGTALGTVEATLGSPPPVGFGFTVQKINSGDVNVDPNETRFSQNSNSVRLVGTPAATGGATHEFVGSGVTFVSGEYRFNPQSLSPGTYPIVFKYKNAAGQKCEFQAAKTFEIYTTNITNLNAQYCNNEDQTLPMNVISYINTFYNGGGYSGWSLQKFIYWNTLGNAQADMVSPANNIFDPKLTDYQPIYSATGNTYGVIGIWIGFIISGTYDAPPTTVCNTICIPFSGCFEFCLPNDPPPVTQTRTIWQLIPVRPAPAVSFSILKTSFCSDETPVTLVGSPVNSDVIGQDFFLPSSDPGSVTSSPAPGVVWSFNPLAVAGVPKSINITYTYRDPATGCTGTSAPKTITINPRPSTVLSTQITSPGGITKELCQGGNLTAFETTAGPTYNWYSDIALSSMVGTGSSFTPPAPPFNSAIPGTTKFYVTQAIAGCESNKEPSSPTLARELSVIVNPTPTQPVPDFDIEYCIGEIIDPNDFKILGGTFIKWYKNGTLILTNVSSPTLSQITTNSPVGLGINNNVAASHTFEVTQTASGCEGILFPAKINVTIKPLPKLTINSSATDPLKICTTGGTVTFKGLDQGNPTQNGIWTTVGNSFPPGSLSPNSTLGTADLNTLNLTPNDYVLKYEYTNPLGCLNDTTLNLKVLPKIVTSLDPLDFCFGVFVRLNNTSTVDQGGLATSATITQTSWNFSDGSGLIPGTGSVPYPATNNGRTKGTYFSPEHKFSTTGSFTLQYSMVTSDGCSYTDTKQLNVFPKPNIDFNWANVCRDGTSTTQFTAVEKTTPTPLTLATHTWNFNVNNTLGVATSQNGIGNPLVNYSSDGTDIASLIVTTPAQCRDTVQKKIYIVPKVPAITSTTAYNQDFNTTNDNWLIGGINSSWDWNTLAQKGSEAVGAKGKGWDTKDINGNNNAIEQSWVLSRCFNFTAALKPVIALDIFSDTPSGVNGTVLQYNLNGNIENDANWVTLGEVGKGINWYDASGISNSPGNQAFNDVGWTGNAVTTNGKYSEWRTAIYKLDELIGVNNVVFRVAFAAGTAQTDGFAFDNVFIGERTRIVLLENFTNSSSNVAVHNTAFKNAGNAAEIVKVQYHTPFPGDDAINSLSPQMHNARTAFYGITESPTGRLDGLVRSGQLSSWLPTLYDDRVLTPSYLKITITPTKVGEVVEIITTVENTSGQIARIGGAHLFTTIVEKSITDASLLGSSGNAEFVFVAKQMLPSPSGITIPNDLAAGQTYTAPKIIWDLKNGDAIVVSVQSIEGNNKEVHQAQIALNPPQPDIVTGIEDWITSEVVEIYPNPANESFVIELPGKAESRLPVSIIDQVGRPVHEASFEKGEQTKTVRTQDLAGGIYIVQIGAGKSGVIRKKVMVVHKN